MPHPIGLGLVCRRVVAGVSLALLLSCTDGTGPAAPTVTVIAPVSGPTAGNTAVTITGTNFVVGGTTVTVGGVALTGVVVQNATTLTGTTPAGTAGAKDVVVTTMGGSATLAGGYTYVAAATVTGIAPASGPTVGNTAVTITGTNFVVGGTTVTVGGAALGGVAVQSPTTLTGTTPAGTVGAKDVVVTTMGGSATLPGGYTYSDIYRDDFNGTSLSAGWQPRGGSWSVGSGYLTGSFSVVGVDAQLTRTNAAGTPTTIRARILNTPGAPQGAASIVFNWVSVTQYYAIELRTNNPTLSVDIVSLGPGGTQGLASCPVGLVNTDTWYILELIDTPAGLVGRLLDGAGNPMACSMSVPGVHVTNAEFGVGVYSGGGLVQVDWIEAIRY